MKLRSFDPEALDRAGYNMDSLLDIVTSLEARCTIIIHHRNSDHHINEPYQAYEHKRRQPRDVAECSCGALVLTNPKGRKITCAEVASKIINFSAIQ
jgi:hypothetical protein